MPNKPSFGRVSTRSTRTLHSRFRSKCFPFGSWSWDLEGAEKRLAQGEWCTGKTIESTAAQILCHAFEGVGLLIPEQ